MVSLRFVRLSRTARAAVSEKLRQGSLRASTSSLIRR
jgi:hypothetical protein